MHDVPTKTEKALHVFIITALIFVFGSLVLGAFWLLYPYKTFTFPTNPLPVKTKTVIAGEPLIYHSHSCRHRIGNVRVNRTFVDTVLVNVAEHNFYQDKIECKEFDNASVLIPAHLGTGIYHLEINSTMQVNPIRSITTKITTEKFKVVNPRDFTPEINETREDLEEAIDENIITNPHDL